MESPSDVLGIDTEADDEEVERAYRRRVLEAHPDHGGSAAEFQQVRRAYRRLQDGEDPAALDVELDGDAADTDSERDATGEEDDGDGESDDESEEVGVTVEYLNYEVLRDHGWELNDDDLFEKAAAADLDPADHGQFSVHPSDYLLESAEECGFTWPYACRGGACSNCAVAVVEGEIPMPSGHILPPEMIDRGIRLSCITAPITENTKLVYNVKHLPGLDELRLTPSRFDQSHLND
ncbi:ferredoxin Fer [Halomarina ordinaria]|uniref:Ferredoxin Fer n=1 Tax=Halomarina ordinaria TaxID=3033939 RepID=A0ABD5U516_9EURY|nr:ferredoxin Fer [Halomarina sp. PSRA2]